MTDGNTYAINKHLDEREDYDALQEVTAELEQAEARIEELEAKLEHNKKLMLALAGDKIDLVSELAGVKAKLAKAMNFIEDLTGCEWPYNEDAKRTLALLKGETDE